VGQFDIKDVEPFVRGWTAETGKKIGVAFAECYRRITLERSTGTTEAAEVGAEGRAT
jgi:hypothetical protein